MNTIKGMIKDLRREETHIGGCTTKGELIIALESLERSVEIPYNVTNGDMIRALFPKGLYAFSKKWLDAPYKKE